jgi:hypothetical protein
MTLLKVYVLLLGKKNGTPLVTHLSLLLDYHILYFSTRFQEKNNVQMSKATCIQIKILRTTILFVLKLGLANVG